MIQRVALFWPAVHNARSRSRRLAGAGVIGVIGILLAAGCTGQTSAESDRGVTIGLVASLSGAFQAIGEDTRDGFVLYLDTHGNRLGGHRVNLVTVDEADGSADALLAVVQLAERADLLAMTGVTNPRTVASVRPALRARGTALVASNAIADLDDVAGIWSTSFRPDEPGQAIAAYLRSAVSGPIWVMAADTDSGRADVAGLIGALAEAGGALANPDQVPVLTADTTNFLPYLTAAKLSGAKAIYASYIGAQATSFVQQYAQSDARDLPLFGPGFLTEGRVLAAQGRAALGVRTALNYAPDLDNPTNRRFVDAWRARHASLPTAYAMASWDAAHLLDQAIAAAGGDLRPEAVNAAIAKVGRIDSPRGAWQFSAGHSPIQKWYLRRVDVDGRTLANSLIQDLDMLGVPGASA
jgi:branched-chain amino acid transport system substrate-binding protein